jgi:hypothetical protein
MKKILSKQHQQNDIYTIPDIAINAWVIIFIVLIFGFHIFSAIEGYSIYRDQHIGTALYYSQHGIDLLKPVIIGFNATETPTPQEFPLWQAISGSVFKILGEWFGWANMVSLILFFSSLYPLYQVTQKSFNQRIAKWALLFYVFQPIVVIQAGRAGTDGTSIAAAIWFLYFAYTFIEKPSFINWLLMTFVGILAGLLKAPFYFAVGIASIFLLILKDVKSLKKWTFLSISGLISTTIFILWTLHCNEQLSLAKFPFVDLRVSENPSMLYWYFGDWSYRLSIFNWAKGGWRALNGLVGSFALIGLVIFPFIRNRNNIGKIWLISGVITTLVFSHLVLNHQNYYLIFSPGIAIMCGYSVHCIECKFSPKYKLQILATSCLIGILLLFATFQGVIGLETVLNYDKYPKKISKIIKEYTNPDDKLLIQGGGWGGQQLILSKRRGMSIWNCEILENDENLKYLKSLGYNKLVMISESPLLNALQMTNPGQSDRKRITYHGVMSPLINDWPTIFQTEDILIKEIP